MSVKPRFPRHEVPDDRGWLPYWLSWRPTNSFLLAHAETRLLSRIKANIESFFVPIFEASSRLRTIVVTRYGSSPNNTNSSYNRQCPIVMLHGMGAGVAMWVKNLEQLSEDRPVYCFDLLGFGRSSRPYDMPPALDKQNQEHWLPHRPVNHLDECEQTTMQAELAEEQLVRSIEEWREQMRIPRFILLGHSLGGYLASAYALRYPHRVSHLLLADPWGFPEFHGSSGARVSRRYGWVFRIINMLLTPFNPLFIVRGSGPFGPMLIRSFRQDLGLTFNNTQPQSLNSSASLSVPQEQQKTNAESGPSHLFTEVSEALAEAEETPTSDEQAGGMAIPPPGAQHVDEATQDTDSLQESDQGCIFDYIYHCNAQYPASGEAAFKSLSKPIGWAVRPMIRRIHDLAPHVPLTFVYGGRSWMDPESGLSAKYLRGSDAYTDVQILEGAGHHVYAQAHEEFNELCRHIFHRVEPYTEQEWRELQGLDDDLALKNDSDVAANVSDI